MTPSQLDTTQLFQRTPDMVAANLDGELVMMNAEMGRYYGISGVGARAFELLETPISINRIVNIICDEYDIDAVTCRQDMQSFVQDLIENRLVQPAER